MRVHRDRTTTALRTATRSCRHHVNLMSLLGAMLSYSNTDAEEKGTALEPLSVIAMHNADLIRKYCLDYNVAVTAAGATSSFSPGAGHQARTGAGCRCDSRRSVPLCKCTMRSRRERPHAVLGKLCGRRWTTGDIMRGVRGGELPGEGGTRARDRGASCAGNGAERGATGAAPAPGFGRAVAAARSAAGPHAALATRPPQGDDCASWANYLAWSGPCCSRMRGMSSSKLRRPQCGRCPIPVHPHGRRSCRRPAPAAHAIGANRAEYPLPVRL